jgi:hypothetical protein
MTTFLHLLAWLLGLGLGAAVIVGCVWWQDHRGDAELGVADTQGRDEFSNQATKEP